MVVAWTLQLLVCLLAFSGAPIIRLILLVRTSFIAAGLLPGLTLLVRPCSIAVPSLPCCSILVAFRAVRTLKLRLDNCPIGKTTDCPLWPVIATTVCLDTGRFEEQVFDRDPVHVALKLVLTFTILLAECTLGLSISLMLRKWLNGTIVLPIDTVVFIGSLVALLSVGSRLLVCNRVTSRLMVTWVVVPVSGMLAVPDMKGMACDVCGPVLRMNSPLRASVNRTPSSLCIFIFRVTVNASVWTRLSLR